MIRCSHKKEVCLLFWKSACKHLKSNFTLHRLPLIHFVISCWGKRTAGQKCQYQKNKIEITMAGGTTIQLNKGSLFSSSKPLGCIPMVGHIIRIGQLQGMNHQKARDAGITPRTSVPMKFNITAIVNPHFLPQINRAEFAKDLSTKAISSRQL